MRSPDPKAGPKQNVTLRLPQALIDKSDELTRRISAGTGGALGAIGISRGEVLRRALEVGLEAMESELEERDAANPKPLRKAGRGR